MHVDIKLRQQKRISIDFTLLWASIRMWCSVQWAITFIRFVRQNINTCNHAYIRIVIYILLYFLYTHIPIAYWCTLTFVQVVDISFVTAYRTYYSNKNKSQRRLWKLAGLEECEYIWKYKSSISAFLDNIPIPIFVNFLTISSWAISVTDLHILAF